MNIPIAPGPARIDEDAARTISAVLAEAIGTAASSDGVTVPFIYPMRIVADRASTEIRHHLGLTDDLIPIHEAQSINCERALVPADDLTVAGELHAAGAMMSISLQAEAVGVEPVFNSVTRLRMTSAAAIADNHAKARTRPVENALAPVLVSPRLPPELVYGYTQAAADFNPIHTDEQFVRSLGLPERVVPGMLLAGMTEPVITRLGLGRIAELKTRFLAPCFVGERVSITVSEPHAAQPMMRRVRVTVARHQGPILCISDVGLEND